MPHKNQKVVFKALGELRKKGVNISLVCVGPNSDQLQSTSGRQVGGYIGEMLDVARQFNLECGCDFFGLGYVDDFSLECIYQLAAALVVPSLYEAGSFPAREAMRNECPVILSQIPALMEEFSVIQGNAWVFEPENALDLAKTIENVLLNIADTERKAKLASQIVTQKYSWEKTARGYLQIAAHDNSTKHCSGAQFIKHERQHVPNSRVSAIPQRQRKRIRK